MGKKFNGIELDDCFFHSKLDVLPFQTVDAGNSSYCVLGGQSADNARRRCAAVDNRFGSRLWQPFSTRITRFTEGSIGNLRSPQSLAYLMDLVGSAGASLVRGARAGFTASAHAGIRLVLQRFQQRIRRNRIIRCGIAQRDSSASCVPRILILRARGPTTHAASPFRPSRLQHIQDISSRRPDHQIALR